MRSKRKLTKDELAIQFTKLSNSVKANADTIATKANEEGNVNTSNIGQYDPSPNYNYELVVNLDTLSLFGGQLLGENLNVVQNCSDFSNIKLSIPTLLINKCSCVSVESPHEGMSCLTFRLPPSKNILDFYGGNANLLKELINRDIILYVYIYNNAGNKFWSILPSIVCFDRISAFYDSLNDLFTHVGSTLGNELNTKFILTKSGFDGADFGMFIRNSNCQYNTRSYNSLEEAFSAFKTLIQNSGISYLYPRILDKNTIMWGNDSGGIFSFRRQESHLVPSL